jgi:hypothetical protein
MEALNLHAVGTKFKKKEVSNDNVRTLVQKDGCGSGSESHADSQHCLKLF